MWQLKQIGFCFCSLCKYCRNRMKNQNLNAMDSTEIGALIIEAGARGDIKGLRAIKRKVNDDLEFQRICGEYIDSSNGKNVLHHAAEMGHLEICKFLIKTVKVYIDPLTYKKDTPLMLAAEKESMKIVEYLISQDAEVRRSNSKGHTALHHAVLKDNKELMEFLLLKGAILNSDSVDGTPLQCAASHGNVEIVKFLLSRGAQQDLCALSPEPALVCALKSHSFECMDALLKAQADPNQYFYGFSPLSYAAKERDTKYLKCLLEAKADPNFSGIGLVIPIEDAALARNREAVEILFPLTEPLEHYPEWTVDGIMDSCHSEQAKQEREERAISRVAELEKRGRTAMSEKDYPVAIHNFRLASRLDPSNPKWPSLRSLCHAHKGRRAVSMFEVAECLRLNAHLPDPHHEDAAAVAAIFKKFLMAGLALAVDRNKWDADEAFRLALFDVFASVYLMTIPTEILSFSPN